MILLYWIYSKVRLEDCKAGTTGWLGSIYPVLLQAFLMCITFVLQKLHEYPEGIKDIDRYTLHIWIRTIFRAPYRYKVQPHSDLVAEVFGSKWGLKPEMHSSLALFSESTLLSRIAFAYLVSFIKQRIRSNAHHLQGSGCSTYTLGNLDKGNEGLHTEFPLLYYTFSKIRSDVNCSRYIFDTRCKVIILTR